MDTKWVTSELAWTSHPESGVRLPQHFFQVLVAKAGEGLPLLLLVSVTSCGISVLFTRPLPPLPDGASLCFHLSPSACLCPPPTYTPSLPHSPSAHPAGLLFVTNIDSSDPDQLVYKTLDPADRLPGPAGDLALNSYLGL